MEVFLSFKSTGFESKTLKGESLLSIRIPRPSHISSTAHLTIGCSSRRKLFLWKTSKTDLSGDVPDDVDIGFDSGP